MWQIGEAYHHRQLGPVTMNLEPMDGNNTNRTLIRIHGDNDSGDASTGCIVLSRELREMIANSGDNVLMVIP